MNNSKYLIKTQNLTKVFGDFKAVDNLNLKIKEGEIFGFLGPNGAGKTTSIRMMVGLLSPTSGQINIRGEGEGKEGENVGICPQELVIWEELTTYENIYFMGNMYDIPQDLLKTRVNKLLEDLQLAEKKDSLASELSGGMKRRLNLGMSVVHEPGLVVLDEPSAGLDPQSRYSLWEYIRGLSNDGDKTIILTTHLMEEADRLSERVGIIDRGKMLVVDTPEKLKKSVGEGDSITVELKDRQKNREALEKIRASEDVLEAGEVDEKLVIRALNAIGQIAKFTNKLEDVGYEVVDVSISRTNTLEDVFIHLTGRGLRS